MKFLIDAQLPRRLGHQLRAAGFETNPHAGSSARQSDYRSNTDHLLVNATLRRRYEDSDFVESFLLNHEPWKLLLVSTGNIGNDELLRLFQLNVDHIAESFETFDFIELNRTSLICHL